MTRVDVIHLTLTGTNRDGEWLRVTRDGYFLDEVIWLVVGVAVGIRPAATCT